MGQPAEHETSADPLWRVCQLALEEGGSRNGELRVALAELQEACAEQEQREEALRRRLDEVEALQAATQEQLLHFRELFEYAPDAYLVTDLAGNIRAVNHTATVLFETPAEFLLNKPLPFFIAAKDRREFYSWLARLNVLGEVIQRRQVRLQPRSGREIHADLTTVSIVDQEERSSGLRWLLRDVTERQRLEESLRAEKGFSDTLLEAAQVLILVLDGDAVLLRTNAYLETVTGCRRDVLAGSAWLAVLPEESRPVMRETLQDVFTIGRLQRWTSPLQTRDGRRRTIAWSARPVVPTASKRAVLLVGHDITDLEAAQQQALRFERLAAIGEVTAGLAHESRNALQRGQACLERLHWKLAGQPEALDLLERAQKAHTDLIRLYEGVRNYAAPIQLQLAMCDPAEVWREVWSGLLALQPRDAVLEEALSAADRTCLADRFRLAQVFRNILENALAACAEPVRVRISCTPAAIDGQAALRIAIQDNGPGLNAEQRERLFEPFYTTKVRGTGLGMAIVKRIVESHGSSVAVGDTPGPGAEIVITLRRNPS
jgi:PAS domain S-box-containing protein